MEVETGATRRKPISQRNAIPQLGIEPTCSITNHHQIVVLKQAICQELLGIVTVFHSFTFVDKLNELWHNFYKKCELYLLRQ